MVSNRSSTEYPFFDDVSNLLLPPPPPPATAGHYISQPRSARVPTSHVGKG
jgi:hypothetical protein